MITQGDGQGRDKDRTAARQQESISEEDDDEGEEAIVCSLPACTLVQQHVAGLHQTGITMMVSGIGGESTKCPSGSSSSAEDNLQGFDSCQGFCLCSSFLCCLIMCVRGILLEPSKGMPAVWSSALGSWVIAPLQAFKEPNCQGRFTAPLPLRCQVLPLMRSRMSEDLVLYHVSR